MSNRTKEEYRSALAAIQSLVEECERDDFPIIIIEKGRQALLTLDRCFGTLRQELTSLRTKIEEQQKHNEGMKQEIQLLKKEIETDNKIYDDDIDKVTHVYEALQYRVDLLMQEKYQEFWEVVKASVTQELQERLESRVFQENRRVSVVANQENDKVDNDYPFCYGNCDVNEIKKHKAIIFKYNVGDFPEPNDNNRKRRIDGVAIQEMQDQMYEAYGYNVIEARYFADRKGEEKRQAIRTSNHDIKIDLSVER